MRRFVAHLVTVLVAAIAAAGIVTVTTSSPPPAGADSNAASFTPISPSRVFDSRDGARPAGGTELTVQTGQAGAVAVAVNITITDTEGWGFLTAWPAGGRPDTSVINVDGADQTIANAVIIPVTPQGMFRIWPSTGMHVLVDVMGAFRSATGGTSPTPPPSGTGGVTAEITGYSPGGSFTQVSGTATNGTNGERSFRIDVDCPGGTTETRSLFRVPAGETRGWSVLCDGSFDSGAAIARIVDI